MKHFILIYLSLIFSKTAFGQTQSKLIYDTTDHYYSRTQFSFVDTLDLWNYKLDNTYKGGTGDSSKPIAQLIFWRTKPIDDKISKSVYKQYWTPRISFEIYNLADSDFCYKKSNYTRVYSSCVPPDVGGDIIVIGKFIFINSAVCLSCSRYDTKVDYCRPVINYIFSRIDKTKIVTLENMFQQFAIKEGTLDK